MTCRSESSVAVGQVVRVDVDVKVKVKVKVTAAVGRSIVNNASVTGDSMFGASIASDPVLPSDDASTAASVVAVTLPATGWSLVQQWLEAATWLLLLGGFTLVIGRRRHPTPMF